MKIIVQDNQTIYDVALQYAGSLEAVIDILEANGKANTTLLIGEELIIPSVLVAKVANFFNDKGVVIATSATPMEVDEWVAPEGLDRKVHLYVNGDLLEVVQAPGDGNIQVVDSNGDLLTVTVDDKIVVPELPCPAPQDGTVEVIDSESNLIGTINVASGGTEIFEVLELPCPAPQDGTVEVIDSESNLLGTINVASGGTEIFEVLDLPCPKDVDSYVPYKAGDDFIEIAARSRNAGVISNIVTSGLSGVTSRINGNQFSLPTNWSIGDVLRIEFNSASADGEIQIIGNYA